MSASSTDSLTIPRVDPIDPEWFNDPWDAIAWLQAEAPVYEYDIRPRLERVVWILTKADDVREGLRNWRLYSSASGVAFQVAATNVEADGIAAEEIDPRLLTTALTQFHDPPEHGRHRRSFPSSLKPRGIGAVDDFLRRSIEEIVEEIPPGEVVNFVEIAELVPQRVMSGLFGVDPARGDDFKRWGQTVFRSVEPGAVTDPRVWAEMFDFFDGEIERRERQRSDDFIAEIMGCSNGPDELNFDEIRLLCWELVVGGQDTTTDTLAGGMAQLLENPAEIDKLRERPELVPNAVEESLRFVSAAKYFMRTATQDITLRGTKIPAGDYVYCSMYAANRDPEAFPDPHRFDVARTWEGGSHLAFGHGPHFCIGAPLARRELQLTFEILLRRFSGWELAGEVVRGQPSTQLTKLDLVPVIFTP